MRLRLAVPALSALVLTVPVGCQEEAPRQARLSPRALRPTPQLRNRLRLIANPTTAGNATAVKVGEPAADVSLVTVSGARLSLSSFKGKKILVLGIGNPFG